MTGMVYIWNNERAAAATEVEEEEIVPLITAQTERQRESESGWKGCARDPSTTFFISLRKQNQSKQEAKSWDSLLSSSLTSSQSIISMMSMKPSNSMIKRTLYVRLVFGQDSDSDPGQEEDDLRDLDSQQ